MAKNKIVINMSTISWKDRLTMIFSIIMGAFIIIHDVDVFSEERNT